MELRLRTLTPLHIGNGEELHSLDYVLHQNRFYRISQQQFLRFLSSVGQEAAATFADWAILTADEIESLEQEKRNSPRSRGQDFNQTLSRLRQGFNYMAFSRKIGREKEFAQYLTQNVPSLSIGNPADLRQQIREHIKTGDGRAYLPGSSVKGAIRTALLFNILEQSLPAARTEHIVKEALQKLQQEKAIAQREHKKFRIDKWAKNFAEGIEHEAFYCPHVNERGYDVVADEKFDVLKFLVVSDGSFAAQNTTVDNIDIFLVKKQPRGKMMSQSQQQSPGVEAVTAGIEATVQIDFNIDAVWGIQKSLRDGVIKGKDKAVYWNNFAEKIRQVYNIELTGLDANNKEELRVSAIHHIMDCVRRFSIRQLSHDEKWLRRFKEHDATRTFSRPADLGFQSVLNRSNGTLLHVGYATGYTGTTEMLYMVSRMKSLFKTMMEEFGIGDSPTAWKNRKPDEKYVANPDDFPKSRRWVSRPGEIIPPGWVEVLNYAPTESETLPSASVESAKPAFPTGKIRQNTELDAEIITSGVPNKIKLFISETNQPVVDLRYGMGFGAEKIGRIIVVAVSGVSGKGEVQGVRFVREK